MPCNCENTECIDVFLDPCACVINTGLIADSSGTWKMMHEFNGTQIRTDIAVVSELPISVPSTAFNEDYKTEVRFYKPDNTIFNDTCYKFNIMLTVFTEPCDADTTEYVFDVVVEETGNSFSSDKIVGVVMTISLNGQDYNSPFFTQAGTTITSTGAITFNADDIVTVTLKH
jgi:hypothetical protein